MAAKKKLRDSELVKLAHKMEELKAKKNSIDSKVHKLQAEIVSELQRRGTKALENNGTKITLVQNVSIVYHPDLLRDKVGPSGWKRITERVLSKEKLAQAVVAGKIDAAVVDECSEERVSSPYVKVSSRSE